MYIKEIEWTDEENKEAILTVVNNKESLICFSYPCRYCVGDIILEPLECLDTYDIISCNEENSIEQVNTSFKYRLKGQLKDIKNGIVKVYGFYLHIKENRIPGDIENGMYIQFTTSRIDIW